MVKVLIDPGHGYGSKHNRGSKIGNEGDNNWKMSVLLQKYLLALGIKADLTRGEKQDPSLSARGKGSGNYDVFISNHSNAGGGLGVEIYQDVNPKNQNRALGNAICKTVSETLNIPNRGVKERRNSRGGNYYGVLRGNYSKAGMIVEYCFHDNYNECKKYVDNMDTLARNVANTIAAHFGVKTGVTTPPTQNKIEGHPIMGKAVATPTQMATFLMQNNPNPKINCTPLELAKLYIKEGEIEGVRGDYAFAQAIKETGFFKYGGDVVPEQNNYAGIGTTGGGVKGNYFATPQLGIQAQIQHLKAYASTDPLVQKQVDPRFHLVKRGTAETLEKLNGRWAVPGNGYGEDIAAIYNKMIQVKDGAKVEDKKVNVNEPSDWFKEEWKKGIELGLTDGTNPKEVATREQVIAIVLRALEVK